MIELNSVSYKIGNKEILKSINLNLKKDEKIIITGPNGAGKSTLALLLSGIIKPTDGNILIDGMDIQKMNPISLRKKIGIIFQEPETQFITMSVEREVMFGLQNLSIPVNEIISITNRTLAEFGIEHLRKRNPFDLSGGEKQLVILASIYAMGPDIIIFDETTTFLDKKLKKKIYSFWQKLKGFIVITEDFEEFPFGERLIVLENGEIQFNEKIDKLMENGYIRTSENIFKEELRNANINPEFYQ